MKKLLPFLLLIPFIAFAAPTTTFFTNIAPTTANTYNDGTASLPWLNFYTKYASTTQITVSGQTSGCAQFNAVGFLTSIGTNCGSGSGTVSQINTNFPILGGPITTTGTLTFGGLSTSSAAVVGNIPYFSGVNTFANVATSTLTPSSPLTGSFTQIGAGGSVGCQAASGSQAGCLSAADWTTFNGKESVLTFNYPLTRSTNTISFNGLSTTSPWTTGQIAYVASNSLITSAATGTVSNGTGISVTAGQSVIGSGLTITNTGVTSLTATSPLSRDTATGAVTISCPTCTTGGITALGSGWATTTASAITFATTTQSFNGLTFAEKITVPSAGSVLFTPNVSGTLNNSGLTNSTITVNSTSIALGASGTITAASSSILADNNTWTGQNRFSFASTTLASLTNFYSGLTGVLIGNGANSLVTAGSAQTCTNQFFRALSATYSVTCASVTDSDFSGQLAVNHGGTGAATLTGLLQGNGASAVTAIAGTAGQFPYYNGTNTLLATSTIFLTSASAVGIGTLTPAAKLDVQGTSTASTGQIADFWKSDGTTVMRIRNDGSVGIGTTTPASTLEVSGIGSSITSSVYSGSGATGGNLNFRMARGTAASPTAVQTDDVLGGIFASGYTSATAFGSNVAAIRMQAAQNFTASNQGSYLSLFTTPLNSTARAEVLRISSAGNVGIGTTSPDTKLTVEGALTNFGQTVAVFRNTGTFNGGGLTLDAASTGNANLNFTSNMTPKATVGYNVTSNFLGFANFAYSSNDFSLRLNLDGSLAYNDGVSSAELFRINVNGRVGIGTTTPANKLTVAGDLGFYGTIPVLSACGTSPAIIVGSTDSAGEITEGAISTGCVITFAVAKTNAPFCTLSGKAGLVFTYAVSASAITITNVGALSSTNVVYHCVQNNK